LTCGDWNVRGVVLTWQSFICDSM